jgi:putative membrane protein
MEYWEWQGMDASTVWWLLGLGLIIVIVFLFIFYRNNRNPKAKPTALEVLQQRFERGEISKQEYLESKRSLEEKE